MFDFEGKSHYRNMHRTKGGMEMPIPAMADDHLVNTIKFLLRQFNEAKNGIGAKVNLSPIQMALYNVDAKDLGKKAARQMRLIRETLMPYVLEASIRNITPVDDLQIAFERKSSENVPIISDEDTLLLE